MILPGSEDKFPLVRLYDSLQGMHTMTCQSAPARAVLVGSLMTEPLISTSFISLFALARPQHLLSVASYSFTPFRTCLRYARHAARQLRSPRSTPPDGSYRGQGEIGRLFDRCCTPEPDVMAIEEVLRCAIARPRRPTMLSRWQRLHHCVRWLRLSS
jgi:hypothetical protein